MTSEIILELKSHRSAMANNHQLWEYLQELRNYGERRPETMQRNNQGARVTHYQK